jgi:hypothetical protein
MIEVFSSSGPIDAWISPDGMENSEFRWINSQLMAIAEGWA